MAGFLELFRPDLSVESITDIDLTALKSEGFECLMLDLDNTLLPWQSIAIPRAVKNWVAQAKEIGMKLIIVSNTHSPRRLTGIATELGVASIAHALKPRRSGFDRAAAIVGSEVARCVVVGDQILTDILGGNLAGFRTIHVKPMHPREFIGTKISRLVERGVLALLARRESGTKPGANQSQTRDTR